MVDFQKVHDLADWARDIGRFGLLLSKKLPLPDPNAPLGHWDEESAARQTAFLQALHPRSMRLQIVGLRDETPTTRTLVLRRIDGPPPLFSAGQYLSLTLSLDGIRTSRPYSISSAPGQDSIEISVKALPGEWVPNHLASQVQMGDVLTTSGPKGHFRYEPLTDGVDLVFLAGGSGITPFMSMLAQFEAEGFRGAVTLLYGNKNCGDVIFDRRLERLLQQHTWLTVHHVYSEPVGATAGRILDTATLGELLDNLETKTFFVCGPRALYQTAWNSLQELGVRRKQIRCEVFGPPKRPELEDGWPEGVLPTATYDVCVEGGPTIKAQSGQPLLNSLERAGVVVPAICRTGGCSACRVKLLEGEVFVPPGVSIRESDHWQHYIHACTAYPVSPLSIQLPT